MKKLITVFLTAALLNSTNASAWSLFHEQTYDECILENMKGVTSDDAANKIAGACVIKTSKPNGKASTCKDRKLTEAEVNLVSGNATVQSYGWMTVKLYNGNKKIIINGGKVRLIDNVSKKTMDYNMLIYPSISPLETSLDINIQLLNAPKKFDWNFYDLTTQICN